MRKEPIIAAIIGSILGVTVAFGVWRFTKTTKIVKENKNQETKQNQNVITSGLEVLDPLNNQVLTENPIRIAGIAPQNTIVAIFADGNYELLKSGEDGSFETELEISGGERVIEIWSLDKETKHISIPVVFTSQVEGDNIALFGTVTDISEEAIQIKTEDDQIEQVAMDENTTYANIVKKSEEIEFSELAIGDYVIVIGSRESSSVLKSSRILVSTVPELSKARAIKGIITKLSSSEFLVQADGEEYSIDATSGVKVTKFDEEGNFIKARLSEANEGEEIIVTGLQNDELEAENIHIFPIPNEEK